MKLKQKILIGIISLLSLIGLTLFLVVNYQVGKLVNFGFTEQLNAALNLGYELLEETYPGPWRRVNNELYKGDVLINGRSQVVDRIRDQTGALATLFLGDTRVATNVTLENGARALGTKAAPEVVETVLVNGRDYTGEAEAVGRTFITRYKPLRDADGKIIGMWFVGIEKAQVNRLVRNLNLWFGLIVLASITFGNLIAMLFTGYILRPIPTMLNSFSRAAQGDLTAELPVSRKDEIGHLELGFNQMLAQQRELINLVQNTVAKIKNNSQQIAAGNEDLAARTEEEAASIEELSATIEEVSAAIQQVAANAEQAHYFSQTTLNAVKDGEEAIAGTVAAMEQISTSSNRIANIIKVVNDISFQTNILALNAAVEAARAGEHGHGFAVVAAEVQNLAKRSGAAAKEIEALISESLERVDHGNRMVQKSGEALNLIVENTQQTFAVINAVAETMQVQARAVHQIQTSIGQLNEVTQENAAMVEELASSYQLLNEEAEHLRQMVNQFKVAH